MTANNRVGESGLSSVARTSRSVRDSSSSGGRRKDPGKLRTAGKSEPADLEAGSGSHLERPAKMRQLNGKSWASSTPRSPCGGTACVESVAIVAGWKGRGARIRSLRPSAGSKKVACGASEASKAVGTNRFRWAAVGATY